jgi:predicted dehydrogenase
MLKGLGMDIVGVCDSRPDALISASRQEGIPDSRHYEDPLALLRETRPDCVIVATTADAHCELTCLAAEYGAKFILCEKPMACSIDDCGKMIEVCRSTGTNLAINHPMRFMNYYSIPKKIFQSEEFGGMVGMTVVSGNIGVSMNGTHFFEAFRYLTDEPPEEVTAWFTDHKVSNPRGPQFEDRGGSVRITTANGKHFYLDCSTMQGHRIMAVYAGPYGQLFVDELAGTMFLTVRQHEHRVLPTTRYGMPSIDTLTKLDPIDAVDLCTSVAASLFDGMEYPTGEEGMLAIRTLVAAYESNESDHQAISIHSESLPTAKRYPWA